MDESLRSLERCLVEGDFARSAEFCSAYVLGSQDWPPSWRPEHVTAVALLRRRLPRSERVTVHGPVVGALPFVTTRTGATDWHFWATRMTVRSYGVGLYDVVVHGFDGAPVCGHFFDLSRPGFGPLATWPWEAEERSSRRQGTMSSRRRTRGGV